MHVLDLLLWHHPTVHSRTKPHIPFTLYHILPPWTIIHLWWVPTVGWPWLTLWTCSWVQAAKAIDFHSAGHQSLGIKALIQRRWWWCRHHRQPTTWTKSHGDLVISAVQPNPAWDPKTTVAPSESIYRHSAWGGMGRVGTHTIRLRFPVFLRAIWGASKTSRSNSSTYHVQTPAWGLSGHVYKSLLQTKRLLLPSQGARFKRLMISCAANLLYCSVQGLLKVRTPPCACCESTALRWWSLAP